MLRYRDGDVRAFEILYERHKGPLYRYLQRMCRSREVAERSVSGGVEQSDRESRAVTRRGRSSTRSCSASLTTARSTISAAAAGRTRTPRRTSTTLAEQIGAAEHERPDAALSEAQVRSDFRRALAELPAEQRDVFVLYEESGLTLEEIGRITGVAMETAKSRLRYAVGKLRTALRQHRPPAIRTECAIVSDPIDIKALDEYLKGGSDISQRYRELGREDVPPELDRRVLDEARAAVAGGGAARSRSWLRWSAPVALAASVVLVVAVVIESPRAGRNDRDPARERSSPRARNTSCRSASRAAEPPESSCRPRAPASGAAAGERCQGRDAKRADAALARPPRKSW